jgi:hypothetical protein
LVLGSGKYLAYCAVRIAFPLTYDVRKPEALTLRLVPETGAPKVTDWFQTSDINYVFVTRSVG